MVIVISSQVVSGHVGGSASVFALQRLGLEVWPIPTVLLSHHPGHGPATRVDIDADFFAGTIADLASRGLLSDCRAILTGYFVDERQVEAAASTIMQVREAAPSAIVCCDPVLGDSPTGLYVPGSVVEAVRDRLVPVADIITPNLFELGVLTDQAKISAREAVEAARALPVGEVLVTSAPAADPGSVATMLVAGETVLAVETARLENIPHGAGDLAAALYLGWRLRTLAQADALRRTIGAVNAVLDTSVSSRLDELALIEAQVDLVKDYPDLEVRRL